MTSSGRHIPVANFGDPGGIIPALDGLRAFAVGAVLLFHLSAAWLPGGYLGVDVFFVISGFLITTLLLRERARTGRINLPHFWLRRARRLLPAVFVLVFTCIPIAGLIDTDLLVGVGRQLLGALTFSTNWVEIIAGSNYFAHTSPLLFVNLWSLAVEEQFYLLWPPLFIVLAALANRLSWRFPVVVALVLAVASGVSMAWRFVPGEDSTRVYYGTDTHAFGLALGAALAFWWVGPGTPRAMGAGFSSRIRALAWPALLGLFVLFYFADPGATWVYRGGIQLAALLSALVILGTIHPHSTLGRILDLAVLRWIGERSYALYLWHWPLFTMVDLLWPTAPDTWQFFVSRALAVVITVAAAAASFALLETPIRRLGFRQAWRHVREWQQVTYWRNSIAVAGGAVVIALVLSSGAAVAFGPTKSRTQLALEKNQQGAEAPAPTPSSAGAAAAPTKPPATTPAKPPSGGKPTYPITMPDPKDVTIFGDSLIICSLGGLKDEFPGAVIDAKSNRQWKDAPGIVDRALAANQVKSWVVFDFGTNAGIPNPQLVRDLIAKLGPNRTIVFVTIFGRSTFIGKTNANYHTFARDYPNVLVADWHVAIKAQPHLLDSDGTHPNGKGSVLFAKTIKGAMQAWCAEQAKKLAG